MFDLIAYGIATAALISAVHAWRTVAKLRRDRAALAERGRSQRGPSLYRAKGRRACERKNPAAKGAGAPPLATEPGVKRTSRIFKPRGSEGARDEADAQQKRSADEENCPIATLTRSGQPHQNRDRAIETTKRDAPPQTSAGQPHQNRDRAIETGWRNHASPCRRTSAPPESRPSD